MLRRGFLVGLEMPWIDEHRRSIDERYLAALDCYARTCLGIGGTELAAAERSARILVEKAHFRESGYRLLMRTLGAKGDVAEALHVYEQLHQRLRDELGVAPGPETQALHSQLLRTTEEHAG